MTNDEFDSETTLPVEPLETRWGEMYGKPTDKISMILKSVKIWAGKTFSTKFELKSINVLVFN